MTDDQYTFQEISRRLLDNFDNVLGMLLPNAKRQGNEWCIGNIHGAPGDSLKVNSRNGMWKDFATGDQGDLVELWGKVRGIGKGRAKREAMAFLGIRSEEEDKETSHYVPYKDGHFAGEWIYHLKDGTIWCKVYRFNHPTKAGAKDFVPWDPAAGKYKRPDGIAPLYGLVAALATSHPVIIVEGEGKVDRLAALGYTAVCSIGGARAAGKTDWSVLRGRSCIIWRDNDSAGKSFEEDVVVRLKENGASSIKRIDIPAGKPEKWDCKDAADDEIHSVLAATEAKPADHVGRRTLSLMEWTMDAYQGMADEQKWLVQNVVPIGKNMVISAAGDAGKGMLMLDLALKVVTGSENLTHPVSAFGCPVKEFGSVVILSAEDDQKEMHRRVEKLDPLRKRQNTDNKLIIVPLPDLGGPQVLVRTQRVGSPETTPQYEELRNQLRNIKNLKLVVIDPISTFFAIDINDQVGCYFAMTAMQVIATELDCSIIMVHHMSKGSGNHPVSSPSEARNAVKGSSAFVDGSRCVYALWPSDDKMGDKMCDQLGEKRERNRIFFGAVVKSNAKADMTIRTYCRNMKNGLLEDRTDEINKARDNEKIIRLALFEWVEALQEAGEPLTIPNDARLDNKMALPVSLQNIKTITVERLLKEFVGKRKLVIQNTMMGRKIDFYAVPGKRFAESVKPAAANLLGEF